MNFVAKIRSMLLEQNLILQGGQTPGKSVPLPIPVPVEHQFLCDKGISTRQHFPGGFVVALGNHYEPSAGTLREYHRFSTVADAPDQMFYYLIRLQAGANLGFIRGMERIATFPDLEASANERYPDSGIILVGTRKPGIMTIQANSPGTSVNNLIFYRTHLFKADVQRIGEYLQAPVAKFNTLFENQARMMESKVKGKKKEKAHA